MGRHKRQKQEKAGRKAQLVFPDASTKVGKPYAMAVHDDAPVAVAVRELVQNALDAYSEIDRDGHGICRVAFKTGRLRTEEIPDFGGYKKALDSALRQWGDGANASVIEYLKSMRKYADRKEVDVLYVIDNGKGLDTLGMDAILSEGTPKKHDGASGSFGVGHLTAYGLSSMNYIFYGGRQRDGKILGAGHAILASFADAHGILRSNNGYFVKKFKALFDSLFEYCDRKDLPRFLLDKLEKMPSSGSVIAILGFNWFRRDLESPEERNDKLRELVQEAVAKNFAIAICSRQLEVFVEDRTKIDEDRVVEFLEQKKDDDNEAKLTLEAIDTYKNGPFRGSLESNMFTDCEIVQRNKTSRHNVSIWRNGMLITRKHAGLSRRMFGSKKLLNALVLLSGNKNPRKAHDLVKNAETPMHDRIQENRLSNKQERSNLKKLLNDIREWIAEHAEETGDESADLSDEILLDSGSAAQFKTSRLPAIRTDDDSGDDGGDHDYGEGEGEKPGSNGKGEGVRGKRTVRPQNIAEAKVQGKFRPDGTYSIKLLPKKDLGMALIKITVDNGADSSCVGTIKERVLTISGAVASGGQHCQVINGNVELKGVVKKNTPIDITLSFDAPKEAMRDVSLECLLASIE